MTLFCLFRIGQLLYSISAGLVTAAVSSITYIVVRWNHWILAESLFTSMLAISTFLCIKTAQKPYYFTLALPAVVFTAFVRPNGMVLLVVFLVYLSSLLRGRIKGVASIIAAIMLVIVSLFAVEKFQYSASKEKGLQGTIIMESERDGTKYYKVMKAPEPTEEDNVLMKELLYVYEYPFYSVKLMASRLYASYSLIRKDYSNRHNLFLYLAIPIYYILVLLGIVVSFRRGMRKEHLLILGLIGGQSAIIAFSMADHDHRYFSYIVNLVTLYFSCGLVLLVDKFRTSPTG